MRKHSEILRLKFTTDLSHASIAQSVGVSKTTVADVLQRAATHGLRWPYPDGLDDAAIEALLYHPTAPGATRPLPDWPAIHQAVTTRKSATLMSCWEEYAAAQAPPQAGARPYGYTRFTVLYQQWYKQHTTVLRFEHTGGERCYVDYSGVGVEIIDRDTGEVKTAQIFVGVLGASSYLYCEATWTQQLVDWIGSHVRMYAYWGGVPKITVPDNLRSAVTKAHRYEPDLNPTYYELAVHYHTAVVPARVRRPRDKAAVEVAVQVVQRRILEKLHPCTFFTLSEVNAAIRPLLEALNRQPMQKQEGSRQTRFLALDQPALQPLPAVPYDYATWTTATVSPDYHVSVEKHFYSTPYELVGKEVSVRRTQDAIEILYQGQRVAAHRRATTTYKFTTNEAHRPPHHTALLQWTPERLIRWGERVGPGVGEFIAITLERKHPHPEQGFRAVMGLLGLEKAYGSARLNAACLRAVHYDRLGTKAVKTMLERGLDQQPLSTEPPAHTIIVHKNLRDAGFFK